jgi:hypothetical protein
MLARSGRNKLKKKSPGRHPIHSPTGACREIRKSWSPLCRMVKTMWFSQYRPVRQIYYEQASPEKLVLELVSKASRVSPFVNLLVLLIVSIRHM